MKASLITGLIISLTSLVYSHGLTTFGRSTSLISENTPSEYKFDNSLGDNPTNDQDGYRTIPEVSTIPTSYPFNINNPDKSSTPISTTDVNDELKITDSVSKPEPGQPYPIYVYKPEESSTLPQPVFCPVHPSVENPIPYPQRVFHPYFSAPFKPNPTFQPVGIPAQPPYNMTQNPMPMPTFMPMPYLMQMPGIVPITVLQPIIIPIYNPSRVGDKFESKSYRLSDFLLNRREARGLPASMAVNNESNEQKLSALFESYGTTTSKPNANELTFIGDDIDIAFTINNKPEKNESSKQKLSSLPESYESAAPKPKPNELTFIGDDLDIAFTINNKE